MFTITITHVPCNTPGGHAPLAEPRTFGGFRAYTGRRAASLYGTGATEVTYANANRQPKSWATREAAKRNLHHLIARGYTARIQGA